MAQTLSGAASQGAGGGVLGTASTEQLQGLAERIKDLMTQRTDLNADITEVFNEAAEAGFDRKILRKAIKKAMADPEKAKAEDEMVETYLEAIQPDLFTGAKRTAPAAVQPEALAAA